MKNFGSLKTKLLKKITESYIKNDKSEIKEILNLVKENKDLKELYLLYEDIENKEITDLDVAKLYVDEISSLLKNKNDVNLNGVLDKLNEELKDIEIEENQIYEMLDSLSEKDSLLNIDKKISVKKKLVEFLTKKKNKHITETKFVDNQNLLNAVLTNSFNAIFDNSLSENEKKELKNILSLKDDQINQEIKTLKEDILSKIDVILTESKTDTELNNKLNEVKKEVNEMSNSKYSFYKLKELRNGLD